MLLSIKLGKLRQTFRNLALELDRVGVWYQRERGNNPCFERLRLPEERADLAGIRSSAIPSCRMFAALNLIRARPGAH